MEHLSKEIIKSKDSENQKTEKLLEKDISNPEKNIQNSQEEDDNIQKEAMTTDFTKEVELTEEEKQLRKNYLKKFNKIEIIFRSIVLSKENLFFNLYIYIILVLQQIVEFRETKYKAEVINGITEKNMEKFISSIKYHILYKVLYDILDIIISSSRRFFQNNIKKKQVLLTNLLLKKDMEFFDLFKTGELVNKVNLYNNFPSLDFIEIILDTVKHLVKIIWLGYRLYTKFFTMSIITIIFLIIHMILEPFAFREFLDDKEDLTNLKNNYINDVLSNIRLVKSFSTEKKELKRINNVNDFPEGYNYIYGLYTLSTDINDILILFTCGRKTISGKMGYGDLLVFQQYSDEFGYSIRDLKELYKKIIDGFESWRKFLEIYDIDQKIKSEKNIIPDISNNENKIKNKNNGLSVELQNVNFSYPTKKDAIVLNNLNMKILPGMTTAIVGSSGSGKTTINNLLLRFYDVNKGKILINNINIKDINIEWLRNNIGIVSQEPILTSGTIKENILYGVENYTEKKFNEVCKLSNVNSFATNKKLFPKEYETIVGERGIEVSGGQKQRIAIARALMKDVKILIFDEATSALDAENEALVQDAINNIINLKHITTIIIAHRLSTIKKADMIYVMSHGSIIESGKHEELLKIEGEYKKLVQRQLVS